MTPQEKAKEHEDWRAGFQKRFASAPVAPERSLGGTIADTGVSALKGVVGLAESVVGLADIPTSGYAGKALESAGVRFKDTHQALGDLYSSAQQQANRNVEEAQGFGETLGAHIANPSTIYHGLVETAPSILGGRAIASKLKKYGPAAAGAVGEGVVGSGQFAEGVRQDSEDGLLSPKQLALTGLVGAGIGAFGALGSKVSKSVGLGDIDVPGQSVTNNSFIRRVGGGAIIEGGAEELPQSVLEQAARNEATGRPIDEGIGKAAASGLVLGSVMGGGINVRQGPLARAADKSTETPPAVPGDNVVDEATVAAAQSPAADLAQEQSPAVNQEGAYKQGQRINQDIAQEQAQLAAKVEEWAQAASEEQDNATKIDMVEYAQENLPEQYQQALVSAQQAQQTDTPDELAVYEVLSAALSRDNFVRGLEKPTDLPFAEDSPLPSEVISGRFREQEKSNQIDQAFNERDENTKEVDFETFANAKGLSKKETKALRKAMIASKMSRNARDAFFKGLSGPVNDFGGVTDDVRGLLKKIEALSVSGNVKNDQLKSALSKIRGSINEVEETPQSKEEATIETDGEEAAARIVNPTNGVNDDQEPTGDEALPKEVQTPTAEEQAESVFLDQNAQVPEGTETGTDKDGDLNNETESIEDNERKIESNPTPNGRQENTEKPGEATLEDKEKAIRQAATEGLKVHQTKGVPETRTVTDANDLPLVVETGSVNDGNISQNIPTKKVVSAEGVKTPLSESKTRETEALQDDKVGNKNIEKRTPDDARKEASTFIRKLTSKEKKSETARKLAARNLPEKTGFVALYKPYGVTGKRIDAGFYYVNKDELESFKKSTTQTKNTGSTAAEIEKLLPRRVRKQLGKTVEVVQSVEDLPSGLKASKADGVEGLYDLKTKKSYLVADRLNKDNVNSVLAHEFLHARINQDPKLKAKLDSAQTGLRDIFEKTKAGTYKGRYKTIYDAALKRVNKADTPAQDAYEEFLAYSVSQFHVKPESLPGRLKKAIQTLLAQIKTALLKHGFPVGKLTPADLSALAMQSFKSAPSNSDGETSPLSQNAAGKTDKSDTTDSKTGEQSQGARFLTSKAPAGDVLSAKFKSWFGKSKMKAGGKPIKFYHGSNADFTVFDSSKLKTSTLHATAGLGHFFTAKKAEAQQYGSTVHEVYIKLENPYIVSSEILDKRMGNEPEKFSDKLKASGFDGIYLKDAKYAIIFESSSAKLTSNQAPTKNRDIRFSKADDTNNEKEVATDTTDSKPNGVKFSKADEGSEPIADALAEVNDLPNTPIDKPITDWFNNLRANAQKSSLGLLSVRQLTEVAQHVLPNLSKNFQSNKNAMNTIEETLRHKAAVIIESGIRLKKTDRDRMDRVADEATMNGVDPAEDSYTPKIDGVKKTKRKTEIRKKINELNELIRKTKLKAELRPGDAPALMDNINTFGNDIKKLTVEMSNIDAVIEGEKARSSIYDRLRSLYKGLTEDAQKTYVAVRDFYVDREKERLEAIIERINDSQIRGAARTEAIETLKTLWEKNSISKPYFPLSRFGDFWVYYSFNGDRGYQMFDNPEARKRFIEANPKIEVLGNGVKMKGFKNIQGVDPGFVAKIDELILNKIGDSPETRDVRDSIYQEFLKTLPELSMRKHQIHRGKVKGYSTDMLRAFDQKSTHDAKQLARLKFGYKLKQDLTDASDTISLYESSHKLSQQKTKIAALREFIENKYTPERAKELLDTAKDKKRHEIIFEKAKQYNRTKDIVPMKEQLEHAELVINAVGNISNEKDSIFASNLTEELGMSYDEIMNPSTSVFAQTINSLGFAYYLGASPAAALVNMLQVPAISVPYAAAKYGVMNTTKAFNQAYKDFFTGKNDDGEKSIKSNLKNKGERDAYKAWHDEGLLTKTRQQDAMGAEDQGFQFGNGKRLYTKLIGGMFHHAERSNREVTALATYRLAVGRVKPDGTKTSPEEASKIAEVLTWGTHLDYGSDNRSRAFRGNTARVLTQFKQYSQGMTFLYYRTAFDAVKNSKLSKEEKTLAKKQLSYLMTTQFAVAGAAGLPLGISGVSLLMAIVEGAFDDEDEPFDLDLFIRNQTADLVGSKSAEVLTKGVSAFLPIDLHSRLEQRNLWVRGDDRDSEGRDKAYKFMKLFLGPSGGLIENFLVGEELISEDKNWRGVEKLMPKAVRDIMKSIRYSDDGVESLRGDRILETDFLQELTQLMGFSPQELSERYSQNNDFKKIERRLQDRRSYLVAKAANARNAGKKDAYRKAVKEIKEFNKTWRHDAKIRISMKSVARSARSRKSYSNRADNGIIVSRRYRDHVKKFDYLN